MRPLARRCGAALIAALIAFCGLAVAAPTSGAATPGPPGHPQYWFDTWQIPALWAAGATGQGVTIAEIDTGVNASLPELAGRILQGTDFGVGGNGQIDREISRFGHGTAMASIMVARPGPQGVVGIAPGAKVLPIALPLNGTTDFGPDDHLAEAIRWAADNGGKVISMSLGGTRTPADGNEPCPSDEQAAIYYALSKGAVLLAAGGNSGQSGSPVEAPGVCLGVVSVGAVDQANAVASFSSRHPYLTLTAPGVNIPSLSRIPGTAYAGNGTSQATAIASAVVALEWSKFPHLTGEQVVTRLMATLDRRTGQHDDAYGYGIVNAHTAVTGTVAATATNPVYTAVAPFQARAQALASPSPAPTVTPPPATSPQIGAFVPGQAPQSVAPSAVRWLLVSAVGLVALLALAGFAVNRRRRRSTGPAGSPPPAEPAPVGAPVAAAEIVPDAAGLQWHDIITPPAEPAPPEHPPGEPTPAEPADWREP